MTNSQTSFDLIPISEIFKDRFFKIPDYQRGYSWEKEQLEDLKKDIENVFERDHKHFTGTIVAAKTGPDLFDIVDGQQRLTTLVILISEIYLSNPQKYADLKALYLVRGNVGSEQNVLTCNIETEAFFNDLIIKRQKPEAKIKSHTCILEARDFFRSWLAKEPNKIDQILEVVTNRLGFILFTPESDKEIGIMFEVINNRGKQLSELEKIKNYFIYFSTVLEKDSLRKVINEKWRELQENLSISGKTGNDDENKFLRYAYLVFYSYNKSRSYYVYDELRAKYKTDQKDKTLVNTQTIEIESFVRFLAHCARAYTFFYTPKHFERHFKLDDNGRINKALTYLRCQPVNASIMPLYLAIMNSFNQPNPKGMDDAMKLSRVADLLEILEKVNMRVYILHGIASRADTFQGSLFEFAHTFHRDIEWLAAEDENVYYTNFYEVEHQKDENIFDWLELELIDMVLNLCPEEKFVRALTLDTNENLDYYQHWGDKLRYLLSCYEEDLKIKKKQYFDLHRMLKTRDEVKEAQNEYLSIEHIWAQQNLNEFYPSNYHTKRRLGNLVLMGLSANISQQDFEIKDKIDRLLQENNSVVGSLDLHQISELQNQFNDVLASAAITSRRNKTHKYYEALAIALCDIREEKIIRFALKRWALPDEKMNQFIGLDSFAAREQGLTYYYQLKETKNKKAVVQ
jgi:hypothetical protein